MTTGQRDDLARLLMPPGYPRRWLSLRHNGATDAVVASLIREALRAYVRNAGGRDGCVFKARTGAGVWAKVTGDRRTVVLAPDSAKAVHLRMDRAGRECGQLVKRAREVFQISATPPVTQQPLF